MVGLCQGFDHLTSVVCVVFKDCSVQVINVCVTMALNI